MICVDDKAIVPIGEPGNPISTAVQGPTTEPLFLVAARMTLKIYFCGSIRGGRQDVQLYANIISQLKSYGTVLTDHVGREDVLYSGGSLFRPSSTGYDLWFWAPRKQSYKYCFSICMLFYVYKIVCASLHCRCVNMPSRG